MMPQSVVVLVGRWQETLGFFGCTDVERVGISKIYIDKQSHQDYHIFSIGNP